MVPKIITETKFGGQLLDIITSGMYDDPLMIYREYIQNSVDAIDDNQDSKSIGDVDHKIEIEINGSLRKIIISDNGAGISNRQAHSALTSIGASNKSNFLNRGFRGIGRLGGLAYCDELLFETKTADDDEVAYVSWSKIDLDAILEDKLNISDLNDAIAACMKKGFRKSKSSEPKRFFRVTLGRVRPFNSDDLMSVKTVGRYLSQVAPVPFNKSQFSFTDELTEHLKQVPNYKTYKVFLNGSQIFRPYADSNLISTNRFDRINKINKIVFPNDKNDNLAVGWYAESNFLSAIPQNTNLRGIRIRSGNIEVGNDDFLANKYSERRFAAWQIGEIHISDFRIKPNARRDGFEHNCEYEQFIENYFILARYLSRICRLSSTRRSTKLRFEKRFKELSANLRNRNVYLDESHYESKMVESMSEINELKKLIIKNKFDDYSKSLSELNDMVSSRNGTCRTLEHLIDGRKLKSIEKKQILCKVAESIINNFDNCSSSDDLIKSVFQSFTKNT